MPNRIIRFFDVPGSFRSYHGQDRSIDEECFFIHLSDCRKEKQIVLASLLSAIAVARAYS